MIQSRTVSDFLSDIWFTLLTQISTAAILGCLIFINSLTICFKNLLKTHLNDKLSLNLDVQNNWYFNRIISQGPTLKWIAYIWSLFKHKTNILYIQSIIKLIKNLCGRWRSFFSSFFFCSAEKWTVVCGPLAVPTTFTSSLSIVK